MSLKFFTKLNFLVILLFLTLILIKAKSSAYAQDSIPTSKIIEQIEQTLLFSDFENTDNNIDKSYQPLEINYQANDSESEIRIIIVDNADSHEIRKKTKLAYSTALIGQYEAAVELYKQILKSEPDNSYVKFSLAVSYHKLQQYKQAKDIYYQLLASNPENKNEIIGNLLDIITNELPNDAIYFLSKLSVQNPRSSYILARSAMAYNQTGNQSQAVLLLNKAIRLNPDNIEYKLNLAIIYDQQKDYNNALSLYMKIIKNYIANDDITQSIPIVEIKKRAEFIKKIKSANS